MIMRTPRINNSWTIPPPSEWLNRYNRMLDRYPLQTKMISSFVLSAFGSALGSYLSAGEKSKAKARSTNNGQTCKAESILTKSSIDWVNVLSYAIHGGLINAPISHFWFEWLAVNGPPSKTASVLLDQLVVQPPLLVCE